MDLEELGKALFMLAPYQVPIDQLRHLLVKQSPHNPSVGRSHRPLGLSKLSQSLDAICPICPVGVTSQQLHKKPQVSALVRPLAGQA